MPVFIMNSLIIKLLFNMLTEFSLTHFNFVLPLKHQLFKLIRDESIVENCEFGSWNESKMSDFRHADHVIKQLLLIENE